MKHGYLILVLAALLLSSCANEKPEDTVPTETQVMTETAAVLATEPEQQLISQEMAMIEGFLVMQDGDVRHNQRNWHDFMEITGAGVASGFSVIHYSYGETGLSQIRYDLSYDGSQYTVQYQKDGETITESGTELIFSAGELDGGMEPYDRYERYYLNDIMLYQDLIAEPDFNGVTEIYLHAKEGEPPVQVYSDEASVNAILDLLSNADYVPYDPLDYLYCMKLLMTNAEGKELIIELEYRHGTYRYGTQTYQYGTLRDLFEALQIEGWPDSVIEEFNAYLNGEFQENLNS